MWVRKAPYFKPLRERLYFAFTRAICTWCWERQRMANRFASGSSLTARLRAKITAPTPTRTVLARVQGHRLYQLIRQKGSVEDRTFEIEFLDPGVQAFAFTFG